MREASRETGATVVAPAATAPATQPVQLSIDLAKARAIDLPEATEHLKPVGFATPDGKKGWALRFPGGQPIATPAYADGMSLRRWRVRVARVLRR